MEPKDILDKKTIIDGIDVSGCEHCVKMTKYRCIIQRDVYKYLCEENPNCYYKQLKRKEQECDQLKVQLLDQKVKTLKASGIICVLEQTLAEIKKICNSVENIENVNSLYDAKLSGMHLQANKILQKISECEVEDEM